MIRFCDWEKYHLQSKEKYTIYVFDGDIEMMFSYIQKMFSECNSQEGILIEKDGELTCLAYDDWRQYEEINRINYCMDRLQENPHLFLKEIFHIEGVYLYGFNEWSYKFYNILCLHHMPVKAIGDKWDLFCPLRRETEMPSEELCMKVNAEGINCELGLGESSSIIQHWEFLWEIVSKNETYWEQYYREAFRRKKIPFFIATSPTLESLEHITPSELWRCQNKVNPQIMEAWKDVKKAHVLKQITEAGSYQEWVDEFGKKAVEKITINHENVYKRTYGEGINTIFLIGCCIVRGRHVQRDEWSLANYILKEAKKINENYRVVAISNGCSNFTLLQGIFRNIYVKEQDVIIVMSKSLDLDSGFFEYKNDIDLKGLYDKRPENVEWFFNHPFHTTREGNYAIAKKIVWEDIRDVLESAQKDHPVYIQIGKHELLPEEEQYINNYIHTVRNSEVINEDEVGAVVMNCNPMTNGHVHLIKEALKYVDFLYIFLVEENRSKFAFKDRWKMVQSTLADVIGEKNKYIVVPSGKFILSYETMPIYFEKADKQNTTVDAVDDLGIFCEKIAPNLGITVRFVGEEPNDKVTRQYNESMKQLFPYYGIRLVEIPRLQIGGRAVSATEVRKGLEEKKMADVKELVPGQVWELLGKL